MKPFRLTPDHYVFLTIREARVVPFVTCSKCKLEERMKGDAVRRAVAWVLKHEPTCIPVKNATTPRKRR